MQMTALVVYESLWGNTEQVARAIAEGLAEHGQVQIKEVSDVDSPDASVTLIAAGGPTHTFAMSRESTRVQAVEQGATHTHTKIGLREWIKKLAPDHPEWHLATFDTKIEKVRHLPGSAAAGAAAWARRHGHPVVETHHFFVDEIDGPLAVGEIERAKAWGEKLGARYLC
jgi:flavodoxin